VPIVAAGRVEASTYPNGPNGDGRPPLRSMRGAPIASASTSNGRDLSRDDGTSGASTRADGFEALEWAAKIAIACRCALEQLRE
jgi:hypothetical protein